MIATRYQANYDQIARDHISYWRETGRNPFQEEGAVARNENATVEIAKKYITKDSKILDAGCGMGDLMLRFRWRDIYGIDMAADYVKIAQERGLNARKGRVERLPWAKETFDLVFATDVLEHVLDLNRVVKELLRVLKPGGVLIARTPSEEVLCLNPAPYDFGHLRRFDIPTFHLLFERIFGCQVLENYAVGDVIHVVARK